MAKWGKLPTFARAAREVSRAELHHEMQKVAVRRTREHVLLDGMQISSTEQLRVLYGPFPIPSAEEVNEEPFLYAVFWFGSRGCKWPSEEDPEPLLKGPTDRGKFMLWVFTQIEETRRFVKHRWNVDIPVPHLEN